MILLVEEIETEDWIESPPSLGRLAPEGESDAIVMTLGEVESDEAVDEKD